MPVVKSQRDLEVNEDGVLVPKKEALEPESLLDMNDVGDEDMETLRILNEQYDKESKKANIPVPPIIVIDDYDKHVAKDFVRPSHYLRYKAPSEKELDDVVEYEMDDEDIEFVTKTLPAMKVTLKEEKFEQIVDRLEKESFKLGKMCEMSVLETYKLGGGKQVTQVFDYWVKKRSKTGRALIRRFQPPTPISDMSPHSTFRPREKEEKRIRRTRKNDKDAHKKLKGLQADFRRAKEILERVVWRERIKKMLLRIEFCLQFAKDIKDVPTSIISEHDSFFKELQREKLKRATAQKKPEGLEEDGNRSHVPQAARPRQVPSRQVAGSANAEEEVLKLEEPIVSAEKAEQLRRCFQHLMKSWDEDGDSAGTSVLPITKDAKFCTSSTPDRESLIYRGRARIGRGGRVIFDRCTSNAYDAHRTGDEWDDSVGSKRSRHNADLDISHSSNGHREDRLSAMLRDWQNSAEWRRDKKRINCNWNILGNDSFLAKKSDNSRPAANSNNINHCRVVNGTRHSKHLNISKSNSLGALSGMLGKASGPLLSFIGGSNVGGNNVDNSVRFVDGFSNFNGCHKDEHDSAASSASTTTEAD